MASCDAARVILRETGQLVLVDSAYVRIGVPVAEVLGPAPGPPPGAAPTPASPSLPVAYTPPPSSPPDDPPPSLSPPPSPPPPLSPPPPPPPSPLPPSPVPPPLPWSPPSQPPYPSAPTCDDLSFTASGTHLNGHIGSEWCSGVVSVWNNPTYDADDEAACSVAWVDPAEGAPTGNYSFDCSLGCAPCIYTFDSSGWNCRVGKMSFACPAPPRPGAPPPFVPPSPKPPMPTPVTPPFKPPPHPPPIFMPSPSPRPPI
eukprot:scaffold10670_cov142-Isochrysis_galbana.AAC.11